MVCVLHILYYTYCNLKNTTTKLIDAQNRLVVASGGVWGGGRGGVT